MPAPSPAPRFLPQLDAWTRAFRFAARSLRRTPGFSAAVLCSLAICLGPNGATLAALHALVLKPLPFAEPEQLVTIANIGEKSGGQIVASSTPQYLDFNDNADLFAGLAAVRRESATLEEERAALRVTRDSITGDLFGLLRVRPIAGRFFTPDEATAGRDRVLVLSQRFWESHFQSNPEIIGREVRLSGRPFTIIGVAPRSLETLGLETSFYQPYVPPTSRRDPQARFRGDLALFGRLKPNVSRAAASAQLAGLEADFRTRIATPATRAFIENAGFRIAVAPLRPGGTADNPQALWLLQAGALLVLLIGAANVANLFLARTHSRRSELAIRASLGAGRAALARESLAESLLLTGAATILGIAAGWVALCVFNAYLPLLVSGVPPVRLDFEVIATLSGVTLSLGVIFGVAPLRIVARHGLQVALTRGSSAGPRAGAIRSALVITQVAVAVVLLIGTGLLLRSFANVTAVDAGFDAARVVRGSIAFPSRYAPTSPAPDRIYRDPNAPANVGLQRRIVASFSTIPGVERVAQSHRSAIMTNVRPVAFGVRGDTQLGAANHPLIHIHAVSPEFFAALGMRLRTGRDFTDADDFSQTPVAIVDETFAARYFPGRTVEGQEIYLSRGLPLAVDAWARIVGVVNRARLTGLDSEDRLPIVFVPMVGFPVTAFDVLVRTQRSAAEILPEMQARLREIDPGIVLHSTGSLEAGLDKLLLRRRGVTLLLGIYSGLALLLAAVGLYGVLAYDVSQRTREIGIRGAIGAAPRQLVAMILRQGAAKTGVGLAVGLVGALVATRYLNSFLFGVVPLDPPSYAAVIALFTGVSLLACWLPARRAAKVDPIVALRAE